MKTFKNIYLGLIVLGIPIIFLGVAGVVLAQEGCYTKCAEYKTIKKRVLVGYKQKCIYTDINGDGTAEESCFDVPV